MSSRVIDTIIRLSGESEYRTALGNCNREMKILKSQLDLTASEFRNNANSTEALTAKGKLLSAMYDSQQQKISILKGAVEGATSTREHETSTVADLRRQYDEAKKKLAEYGEQMDENNEEYQQAKAAVDKLREAIVVHQAKLDSSTKAADRYEVQLNKAQIALDDLSEKIGENNRYLQEASESADGCAKSIDNFGKQTKKSADSVDKDASAVEALATAMVASGVKESVETLSDTMMVCSKAAAAFESSFAKVSTLADTTKVPLDSLRSGILSISSDLDIVAEDISEAVYQALSAGVDTSHVLDFVRQSSQLAVAGFTDSATAVDVLTTILNSYGMEAAQTEAVASKLVKTQDLGKLSVADLGKVLGRIIPSAAAYGVNLDNVAAAYANMTAGGINAENTTTYLSTMLDELSDSGSSVSKILREQTGKSFSELMAEGQTLGDVLDILGQTAGGNATEFANLWQSATAGKGAVALFNAGSEKFNQTMLAMESSSGAVAANYKKIADTSEHASQRVATAAQNLKIAVGEQLNPVLNNLRNFSADIVDGAAQVVRESPGLVSIISGVTVAVGALAAAVSGLMAAKAAAEAMKKLNIAILSNPYVLAGAAIIALVTAIGTYVSSVETTKDRVDALTESSRALSATVSDSKVSYEESIASTQAAASMAEAYIGRMKELEAQGLKNNESQAEYAMRLEKLNSIMPGLNAELDAETHAVKGGTAALAANAEAWKEKALQEAAYSRYKDVLAKVAAAELEIEKNTLRRIDAEKSSADLADQLTAKTKELSDAQRRLDESFVNSDDLDFAERRRELVSETTRLQAECDSLTKQLGDSRREQNDYTAAVDQGNESLAAARDEISSMEDDLKSMGVTMGETGEQLSDSSAQAAGAVDENFQRIQERYAALLESARASAESQIGLFQKLSDSCDMTVRDMIDALKSQYEAYNNYSDNLIKAADMGFNDELMAVLANGTEQSMQWLNVLVNGTEEDLAKFAAAFEQKDTAYANMTETVAAANLAREEGWDGAEGIAYAKGFSLGEQQGEGQIQGMRSKIPAFKQVNIDMFEAGFGAGKMVSMVNSPSKRYMWLAQMETEGLLVQKRNDIPRVEKSAEALSEAGYRGYVRSQKYVNPFSAGGIAASAAVPSETATQALLGQILTAVKDGKTILLDGRALVGGTAQQYDQKLGAMRVLTERGAL